MRTHLAAKIIHEKKCKCAALHGLFHHNKHFGMIGACQKNDVLRHKIIYSMTKMFLQGKLNNVTR